jgi:protein SCO1
MKYVLAVFALVLFSLPSKAALSSKQLSAAILDPIAGAALPLKAKFTTSAGAALALGDAVGDKPAAVILVDYTCRFICGTTLAIAAYGLSATDLEAGRDFSFIVMGIDPKDKPADAKAMKDAQLAPYPGLQAAAHFLNGDAAAIASVTSALNYTPIYDAETDEYAHPAGVVILTPDGRVSRVISGLNLNPVMFKAALTDAGRGPLSSRVEGVRLLCYGHSPLHGAYAATVRAALAAGGVLTLAGIAGAAVLLAKRGGHPS